MGIFYELRRRAQSIVGPVIGVTVLAYFAYHVVQGDRGLFALRSLQARVEDARASLGILNAERRRLEHRVSLLNPNSLDPDMADERARYMLHLARPDELVVMLPPDAAGKSEEGTQ